MPRFVLLYHACPPTYERASHWDFMLESGDVLRTWALERLPRDWSAAHSRTAAIHGDCPAIANENTVSALQLGDHRREYLEIEGPLSGDRGSVVRVATGTFHGESESPEKWKVVLLDTELAGGVALSRPSVEDANWTLEFRSAS